jgi:hypothetical protein
VNYQNEEKTKKTSPLLSLRLEKRFNPETQEVDYVHGLLQAFLNIRDP